MPIHVRGLQHWFGLAEARKQALFDIDLNVDAGQLVILMGPSGSGKTTLLTLLGCLRAVEAGEVYLLGTPLRTASEQTLISMRRQVGFIFQAHNLHASLTAMQNVRMGLEVHGRQAMQQWHTTCRHMLELVNLGDRLDYKPANLSGGQKQRVAIARALVGNPRIVLADEPTAALDQVSGLQVVKLLKKLGSARGTTTLMVTHDNRILEMADRIITMVDGRIKNDIQQQL